MLQASEQVHPLSSFVNTHVSSAAEILVIALTNYQRKGRALGLFPRSSNHKTARYAGGKNFIGGKAVRLLEVNPQ